MKKLAASILLVWGLLALFAAARPVSAASNAQVQSDYRLNVQRTFGYSSGNQIRGTFAMEVVGPDNIESATFLIDGKPMAAAVTQKPFKLTFQTTAYPDGPHELTASLKLYDSSTVVTSVRSFVFATAEQESSVVTGLVLPMIGIVFLVVVVVTVVQVVGGRKRNSKSLPLGAPRSYGLKGGSICPRCHRPFGLHALSVNLLVGVYDYCDFCGKWAFYRPLSQQMLKAAEAAELQQAQPEQPIHEKSKEEKLKEMLDDSRFTDQK